MKILFIGDSKFDSEKLEIESNIKDICSKSDIVLANLEGPILSKEDLKTPLKKITRYSNIVALKYLKELQINLLNLSNNHIMDFGDKGLEYTVKVLKENGHDYFGVKTNEVSEKFNLKIKKINNETTAFLTFSHKEGVMASNNSNGPAQLPKFDELKSTIDYLKKQNDNVVFIYHGGEEYYTVPWPRRREYFKLVAKETQVDAVIGHHSHTIQPIEIIHGKPIIYSLGNFVFDSPVQRKYKNTEKGLMVLIDTEKKLINLYYTKYDRDENSLVLFQEDVYDCNVEKKLENQRYFKDWCGQVNKYFNRNTGLLAKRSIGNINLILRKMFYFINAVKNRDIRNLDILFSSNKYLKKLMYNRVIYKKYRISKFKY